MILYYFLPDVPPDRVKQGDELSRDALQAAGLAEVLADVRRVPAHASVSGVHDGKGPGGHSGTVITPVSKHQGLPKLLGHHPARQTWLPIGDGSRAWVGALTKQPPMPQDLERWQTIGGIAVTDPGHFEWTIPVGRAPDVPYGTLPQSYAFDASGEPVANLQPAWQWLWVLAGELRDWYASQIAPPEAATPAEAAAHERKPLAWLVKQAARILAVNYRVGPTELNLLHQLGRPVLTQQTVHAICQSAFGWEVLAEAKKKPSDEAEPLPPNSSPSVAGDETPAESPGTALAGEPC